VLKFGQKIIALVQMDQQSDFPLTDCILVVGGGNGEYILELDGDLATGQKNLAHSRSLIGGGGINQTLRLLKAGYSPLPILPLGNDLLGQKIHHELLQEYQLSSLGKQVLDYISNDNFLVRDLKTRLAVEGMEPPELGIGASPVPAIWAASKLSTTALAWGDAIMTRAAPRAIDNLFLPPPIID
jgi:hypothetical protein